MEQIIILLLLPLCSFLLILCLQSFKKAALNIAIGTILILTTLSISLYFRQNPFSIYHFLSFKIEKSEVNFSFFVDNFNVFFLIIIHLISSAVFIFSLTYMKKDKNIARYFAYLCLFIGIMTALILSSNLLQIYIFWELVGLVSYLLIGFWREKKAATNAAKLAFLTNRVGDIGFLIGILGVWQFANTTSLDILQSQKIIFPFWIGFALFCGVMGKSAQFPLHFWLPKAMQGPTPVSALLHAATMVAAGIYLLLRISPFLPPALLTVIAYFGGITAFLGGFLAINQWDIKKILAYSTISQLGFMVIGVGVGASWGAMFHLFTHAFFKAGLFLCAGSFIHYLHQNPPHTHTNEYTQDLRNMRNLSTRLPFVFIFFSIFSACLIGLPFTSGFFSKEEILQNVFHSNYIFLLGMNIISVFFTSLYVSRMWFLLYFSNAQSEEKKEEKHEKNNYQLSFSEQFSIGFLGILALLSGYIFFPATFGYNIVEHHSYFLLLLILVVNFLGILIGYYIVKYKEGIFANNFVMNLSKKEFFIDNILRAFEKIIIWELNLVHEIEKNLELENLENLDLSPNKINLAHQIEKKLDLFLLRIGQTPVIFAHILAWFDRHIIDGIIHLFTWIAKKLGSQFNQLQNGQLQNYLTWVILIVIGIVWWLWK